MAAQVEDLIDEPQDELEPVEQQDGEEQQTANDDDQRDDDEEVDVVSWGNDAVAAEDEPEGMRNLRNRLRELERENKTLKAPAKVDEVGPEPDMDDYWDKPEQYKTDLLAWNERKRQAGERETQAQEAARKQQERWEAQHREFEDTFTGLRVSGKDTARSIFEDTFQGQELAFLIKAGGKNAAGLALRLGSSEEDRNKIRALFDNGDIAEAIAEAAIMGKETNVQRRKPTTAPDQNHAASGTSGGGANAGNQALARLEAQARKTGNWSEVFAYKRKLNNG